MNTPVSTHPDLTTWGLSPQTIEVLSREPEILDDLAQVRSLPPLPPGHSPAVVEVLFEDVPYLRSEQGGALRSARIPAGLPASFY